MSESKSLVHMAISVMLASLFIGAAASLLTVSYKMWAFFSRQENANLRLREYVNYVSYDNTTIQGQEIVSLLHYAKDNGIIVYVNVAGAYRYGHDGDIDYIVPQNKAHIYVPDNAPIASIQQNVSNIPITATTVTEANALVLAKHLVSSLQTSSSATSFPCNSCFQAQVNAGDWDAIAMKLTTEDCLSGPDHSYAKYRSFLVYESEQSADPFGVVLIKVP